MKELVSWNVNGIRACEKKGFIAWLKETSPDVVALQETKAAKEQLEKTLVDVPGYKSYWASAEKRGYSGVALYSKLEPERIEVLGIEKFDAEGRVLMAWFENFVLMNCYFPNSQEKGARLDYKLEFCDAVLAKCNALVAEGRNIVLCGDYNIAHTEIDCTNPKSNEKNPGFLPEERAWMTKFLGAGYTDTFRSLHPGEPGHYSWWSYRFKAREKDIGWRIDCHCVNNGFRPAVKDAKIHKNVMGSDHCPVSVVLDV